MARRLIALLIMTVLVAAACGSNVDEADEPSSTEDANGETAGDTNGGETGSTDTSAPESETSDSDGPPDEVDLTDGWFGTLEVPCGPAPDGVTLTDGADLGVTAESITIANIADVTGPVPGLNEEAVFGTRAFAAWCNDFGGINGREIIVEELDTALFEYAARVEDACGFAFSIVGNAAVFDSDGVDAILACDLMSFPAFSVSEQYASSDRMYQSGPNPPDTILVGSGRAFAEQFPEKIKRAGVITAGIETTQIQRDKVVAGHEELGFEFVYNEEAAVAEQNWGPFAQGIKEAGVEVMFHVATPDETGNLLAAMETQGIDLEQMHWIAAPNYFNPEFLTFGADRLHNWWIEFPWVPFFEAEESAATEELIQILDEYEGKPPSQNAMQAFASALLFAVAAQEAGPDLTRDAVLEVASGISDFDAGGLNGGQDVAADVRSPCSVTLTVNEANDGFERLLPAEGFDCEPTNVQPAPIADPTVLE